ncbi:hypothetical protein WN943_029290 [Citrus x changshan-huyou]
MASMSASYLSMKEQIGFVAAAAMKLFYGLLHSSLPSVAVIRSSTAIHRHNSLSPCPKLAAAPSLLLLLPCLRCCYFVSPPSLLARWY